MRLIQLDIKTKEDLLQYIQNLKTHKPLYVSYDTETNGLHIKYCLPFLTSFGFVTNDFETIYTYTLDFELAPKQLITDTMYVLFNLMFKKAKKIIGHNISYDLHMFANIGYEPEFWDKYTDTQLYIRLAHDVKKEDEGGAPLKLKGYASRYIDPNAKHFESKLKDEITAKKKENNKLLKQSLKGHPIPERYTKIAKSWTLKVVEKFLGDSLNELSELPIETQQVFEEWFKKTDDPENYRLLNRENVTTYAHFDIVYTLKIFVSLRNIIIERGQEKTLKRENEFIEVLWNLERNGFNFNYEKALEVKPIMRNYIIGLRKELHDLAGEKVSVNQSIRLKEIYYERFLIQLSGTSKDVLESLMVMDVPEEVKRMTEIIQELRSLEKWYTMYLLNWIKEAETYGHTVYPTYHQAGTLTGRVSSAFQQFPKKGKYTIDGEYLFHPRELFLPPEGRQLIFFDYSAMEMRLLAIYTILIGKPDLNLVRSFQPHMCYREDEITADRYSFIDAKRDKDWQKYTWYREEDGTEWTPTDIHALTAKNAFEVTEEHPDFKSYYRAHGKSTNFSIVYGATPKTIAKNQKLLLSMAQKLYDTYYKTYPGVKAYNDYIRDHLRIYGYLQNLYGRRYYGCNAHKGKNYNIQGSGADHTKAKGPELLRLCKKYDLKLQMYLHDGSFSQFELELLLQKVHLMFQNHQEK